MEHTKWQIAGGGSNLIPLRSPSASLLEATLTEAGYKPERARQLAEAGALSLANLKRHLSPHRLSPKLSPPECAFHSAEVLQHPLLLHLMSHNSDQWDRIANCKISSLDIPSRMDLIGRRIRVMGCNWDRIQIHQILVPHRQIGLSRLASRRPRFHLRLGNLYRLD